MFHCRMPLTGDLKSKWLREIEGQQSIQKLLLYTYVNVCSLHFAAENILKNKKLKQGAIPTIFKLVFFRRLKW